MPDARELADRVAATGRRSAPPLACDRRGSGPPLMLLHALGADRRAWDPVLDRLAAERDVVAVDLPGFGGSPPLEGGTPDPPALARAVAAFARDELGLDRPHVAGNSLGGWVALELGLAGAARSVTAIAPAGLWPEPLMPKRGLARTAARLLLPIVPPLVRSERGRRALLAGTVARPDRIPPASAAHLVRAYATAAGFREVNDAMRAGRFRGLGEISVPVTLAWCEHDRLVAPPRHVPLGVRSVRLRGCGHVPAWDEPEQIARVLLDGSSREFTRGG
jgi:pimeloyl-ACP methyl ester carboxylesterase